MGVKITLPKVVKFDNLNDVNKYLVSLVDQLSIYENFLSNHTHRGVLNDFKKVTVSGSTVLTSAHIYVGNNINEATDRALSGEATLTNLGVITLSNAAIIAKVLTGYTATSGSISAADSILSAIQKLGYDKHIHNQTLDTTSSPTFDTVQSKYKSSDGTSGLSYAEFHDAEGDKVVVKDGLIVGISV